MSKEYKRSDDPEGIDSAPSLRGEIIEDRKHDAVFGEITEDAPDYRNVRHIYTFESNHDVLTPFRSDFSELLLS